MTLHNDLPLTPPQVPITLPKQRKSSWRPSLSKPSRKTAPVNIHIQPTPYPLLLSHHHQHLQQTSPTSSQDISPTPPPVAPYSLKTRHEKSFANQSCCFCEESLEIQLTNERVLALECSHVCHFGCLLLFAEKDPALFDNINPDAAMPDCPSCNQNAIPLDNTIYKELCRQITLAPDSSPSECSDEYAFIFQDMADAAASTPQITLPQQQQQSTDPIFNPQDILHSIEAQTSPVAHFTDSARLHKQSTTMQFAIAPWESEGITPRTADSETNHLFSDRDSNTDSLYTDKSSIHTSPLKSIMSNSSSLSGITNILNSFKNQEISAGIPDEILKARLRRYKLPSVTLTPELETIFVPDQTSDSFVTTLVTVVSPPKPELSQNDPYLNQPEEIDSKVRADLTQHVKDSIPDSKQLELSEFGTLRLHDKFSISANQQKWKKDLDCFLFDNMLIFFRIFPNLPCTLRRAPQLMGKVNIRKHLISITFPPSTPNDNLREYKMTLNLATPNVPTIYLKTSDIISFENWHTALMNWGHVFPLTRLVPPDDYKGQSIASQMFPDSDILPSSPRAPTTSHIPTDTVILVPIAGSPMGSKFLAIKETISAIISEMQLFDRLALVPYGGGTSSKSPNRNSNPNELYGLASGPWKGWPSIVESLGPNGMHGSRADMVDGLERALNVLDDRKSMNPISSIYVISDSAATTIGDPTNLVEGIEKVVKRATNARVKINSIGVTMNHLADDLDVLSTRTGGSYVYLRDWEELQQAMLGRFRATQEMAYSEVSLCIDLLKDARESTDDDLVIISEISGHSIDKNPVSQAEPLPSPLLPSPTSTEEMPLQKRVKEHLVKLGNMAANETRTFLVQVRVRHSVIASASEKSDRVLNLFNASLSYVGYTTSSYSSGDVYFLPIGDAAIPIESTSPDLIFPLSPTESRLSDRMSRASLASSIYSSYDGESHYTASTLSLERQLQRKRETPRSSGRWFLASTDKPSILFGELVKSHSGDRSSVYSTQSVYLSLELYDVRVVQRRIELTAANLFEYILRAGYGDESKRLSTGTLDPAQHARISKVLDNVREGKGIIHGLLGCAVARLHDSTTTGSRYTRVVGHNWDEQLELPSSENDTEDSRVVVRTKEIVQAVDQVLATVTDLLERAEMNTFEQDYRKLLMQYIGMLRLQRAYIGRTALERLYL